MHTSAKAVLPVAIRIRTRIRIRDPDRYQYLIIYSLAHCQPSLKISWKSVPKFLCKVANSQTNRQTNDDNYISSFAVVKYVFEGTVKTLLWQLFIQLIGGSRRHSDILLWLPIKQLLTAASLQGTCIASCDGVKSFLVIWFVHWKNSAIVFEFRKQEMRTLPDKSIPSSQF